MKYGYFDDKALEYVITTPRTPLPWINYLGCNDFFSIVSNTCGGYSFYKDAKMLRMENITTFRTEMSRGIQAGSRLRHRLISTNAGMASATPVSLRRRTD